ncbi:G-protein coupled receptor Mth isoform X1 [Drosophila eugracilis]|uniref:G-protein coupled receptor Mth isoform X1 n=2 Tax=Drosophila eugracilis TaxID=29029 RepID=UPI0007E60065|nr:G-protein coupled receptor Mth isoform X1 [Drosophila eugracilis]
MFLAEATLRIRILGAFGVGFLSIVLLVLVHQTNGAIPDCDFFDTADISKGQKFPNGSYLYEGLLIPPHLTGEYDIRVLPDNTEEKVPLHTRGCVCKLKPCVRFCCQHDHLMHNNGSCYEMSEEELNGIDPILNVTLANGSVVGKHFKTDFFLQWGLPTCDHMFSLDNRYETDHYSFFEDGSLFRHLDEATLNKRDYCFQHVLADDDGTSIRIVPHNCPIVQSRTGQTTALIISLVCMVLTISVYLFVKELQNLHGKCFVCYMVSLFLGYLFLLLDLWDLSADFCITAGFLGYFFVMAAFFWLSVISLHMWNTFNGSSHGVNRFLPEHRFLAYNIYSWGMAVALTGITFAANELVEDENWNPRMGVEHCWINTREWSAMLYFYGPMVLLITFNIIMFLLTAVLIVRVKKDIQKFSQKQMRTQKLNSDKQTYTFFLRLFIIMGLSWTLEIVSYFVQDYQIWSTVFLVADYINWSQGTIIFVLFILKRNTLRLLKKRHHPSSMMSINSLKSKERRNTMAGSFAQYTRTSSSTQL